MLAWGLFTIVSTYSVYSQKLKKKAKNDCGMRRIAREIKKIPKERDWKKKKISERAKKKIKNDRTRKSAGELKKIPKEEDWRKKKKEKGAKMT